MILDTFNNAHLYYGLCPLMERAFKLLAEQDLAALPAGKHLLDGEDIFVNIMEIELKEQADAKLEVHNVYADIQILLIGEQEGFGWRPRAELTEADCDFSEERDVQFFNDKHQMLFTIHKGQFTILMPEDGHAPMVGEGAVKKAIVKVRI